MNTEILQDRTRAAYQWSRALQKDNTDIHTANETLLAFQFNQLLEAITFDTLKTKVEQNPKEFFETAAKVNEQQSERTKRLKIELELETFRDQVAEQKRKLQETIAAGKTERGIDPEVIEEIEAVMAQL
jgi:hypothetical protein